MDSIKEKVAESTAILTEEAKQIAEEVKEGTIQAVDIIKEGVVSTLSKLNDLFNSSDSSKEQN
jgi:hypothetical protein